MIFDSPPDDTAIADLWVSPYALACVTVGLEIGLFDSLAAKNCTCESIANTGSFHTATLEAVLRVLCALQLVKQETPNYCLTQMGQSYFMSSSPFFRAAEFLQHGDHPVHQQIMRFLKRPDDTERSFSDWWQKSGLNEEQIKQFVQGMQSMNYAPATAVSGAAAFVGVTHLVDAGGGSGAFARALVANNEHLEVTIFDLPEVCKVANTYMSAADLERIRLFPGDFLNGDWPSGADAILFSNVLHDWSIDTVRLLIGNAAGSLKASKMFSKRIFILEALLDEDRCGPVMVTIFDLHMKMAFGGQQFSFRQLECLLREAGFVDTKVCAVFGYYRLVTATLDC